jgi:tight adherence protein B
MNLPVSPILPMPMPMPMPMLPMLPMLPILLILKWACTGALFAAGAVALWALLEDPQSWPHRYHRRYVAHLDHELRRQFLSAVGRWIFVGQLFALEASALACVWVGSFWLYLTVPAVLLAPALWLTRLRVRSLVRLEKQIDGFLLTLANSLRATPSLGSALVHTQRLIQKPMQQELGLALQELRVGNSVDRALLNLGARVRSAPLDSALLALLIGRQIGGDLTKVLETTAATLREMARLRGVLRSKTAEAKAQMWVMAALPVFIVFGFDALNPGYFEPLLSSWNGSLIAGSAALLWLASLLIAQRLLAVKL